MKNEGYRVIRFAAKENKREREGKISIKEIAKFKLLNEMGLMKLECTEPTPKNSI